MKATLKRIPHEVVPPEGNVIAYLRVSTRSQEIDSQRIGINDWTQRTRIHIDEFMEVKMSSRKSEEKRRLDELFDKLQPSDCLVVSELSRLGRTAGQVATYVNALIDKGVRLVTLKEGLDISGKHTMQSKIITMMFAMFSELERDLISERTKEGLARAKAMGKHIGRTKGIQLPSKLDPHKEEISNLLGLKVNKEDIRRMMGVSRCCLDHFIKTRKVKPAKDPKPVYKAQKPPRKSKKYTPKGGKP